ncbi:MAG TPA: NfeD family protein [Nevskiaceae bacterium]|nr:NfeD family protein [Nevskiaceae bacterium]
MFLEGLVYWHWWLAGLVLLTLEALVPGAIFLWIGISAFVVGAIVGIVPSMGWQLQCALFAALSIVSVVAWRKLRPQRLPSDQPVLNRRGESYVGRQFTLEQPIVNGTGKLRVDDSQWRISGPDLPTGARVRVMRAEGATLHVEAA